MDRRTMIYLSSIAALGCLGKSRTMEENAHITHTGVGEIEKRVIPGTKEKIAAVGLGTWQTFDVHDSKEDRAALKDVLRKLVDTGGSVIDSSPMYGSSENVVGDLSKELKIRPSLFMATKVWTRGREAGIVQMNDSFSKLRTEVMDLMQVHNLVDVKTHLKTLREWKEKGKVRYIGITHYTSSAYPEMIRLIKNEKPDFVQFNYNLVARDAEKELLPVAKENNCAVLINRPFEEGQLFSTVRGKSLPSWAAEHDINSWGQFFLKFILSHPAVTCVIPGTSKVRHMEDNLGAAMGRQPDEATRKRMIQFYADL